MTLLPGLVISLCVVGHVTGRLQLINNGYEGLTVVIKENVKEDPALVSKIKESVTEFSSKMYIATKNRAYIRDVAIVLPKSWTKQNNVTDIPSITSKKQIIIIESSVNSSSKSPYVTGNVECGKGGRTMNIAPEFFLSDVGQQLYGSPGNVLLHEWSHLRWGLFDEYPSLSKHESRGRFIKFYYSGGDWQPVRCTREFDGEVRTSCAIGGESKECGLWHYHVDRCEFCPRRPQQAKASLLYAQYLPSVHSFCDKDSPETDRHYRHNSDAKNKQNAICDRQSAWEVMRTHEDFAGDANTPGLSGLDTTPTFRVMRQTGRYIVFVLDVSGSMKADNRLEYMQQSVRLVVITLIETGSRLGMVEFSSSARTLVPLTQIQGSNNREEFIEKIPKVAVGGTSIGAGLKQALQILHGIDTHQTEIILITDGQSSEADIESMTSDLIAAGVVVHTIAVTQQATDALRELSEDTGGTALTYLGTQDISFADTMYQAAAPDPALADHTTPERLHSKIYTVTPAVPTRDSFAVDDGLGNSTTTTVMTTVATNVTLTLTGPANFRYSETRTNTKTAVFELGDQTLVGNYYFEVITDHQTQANVMITSKPASPDSAVLRVRSWLSDNLVEYTNNTGSYVFAEVRKGNNPVLDANVTAILESDNSTRRINLTDTGTGADKIKDDGIYTGGILNDYLDKNGRYNIKLFAKGDNSTFTWSSAEGSRAGTNPEFAQDDQDEVEKKLGIFNRLSLPGEITVVNYDPQVGDITPPAKIQDLQTDNVTWDHSDKTKSVIFTFSWTAVGDDMDVGQATRYDMVLATNTTNTKDIEADKTNRRVNMTLMTPSPSGQLETFNMTLTEEICNGTCTVFITAYDESGNKGPWSNVVFVDINYPEPVPPPPLTTTKTTSTGAGLHVSFMSIGLSLVCVLLK